MKLVHALIAKSIVETILIGVLAINFYLSAFPPAFKGWGEVQPQAIYGWAVNQSNSSERVAVQLFIDGQFFGITSADLPRPDVMQAGWSEDEFHGYAFAVNSINPGVHTARIYALHTSGNGMRATLQLLGDPLVFVVAADGQLQKTEK